MRHPTMKALTAAALALCLSGGLARADDEADRRAAAEDVLTALHSADMVTNIVPAIIGQIRVNLTRNDPTLVRQFDGFAPRLQATADAQKAALMKSLVDVYARTYTVAELRDMLAYFKSPVGQRIIQTQAQVNHDMLAATRDWGTALAKTLAADATTELQGTPAKTP